MSPSTTLPSLPPITSLQTLPPSTQTATLDLLFEPSADLHALALPTVQRGGYTSYGELIDALRGRLIVFAGDAMGSEGREGEDGEKERREKKEVLFRVLGSHPRLGEKDKQKKEAAADNSETHEMSALSKAEQARLRSGDDGDDWAEELRSLNAQYEARYPGLRYVVWVNGRGREEIVKEMRERIGSGGSLEGEVRGVVEAMCDIAADRARKLQKAADEVEKSES
ncbi:Oxo-4-hydroxy-4-carboxy-5-ureidoimidazoline decarboxylase [Chaetomium sp. MPI-SDFR-AT-0129]|nr:Oxo-4-hydroxy-4-carboxy-5-ureidoimidazoline decarboxylase [Chaetomium sp. MPI-SDFR-AT-0129]